jgi:uroporphyrinogen-III decarboxylase
MTKDRLADFDFARHNAEAREVWDAYLAGTPTRTPIMVVANARFMLLNRELNSDGMIFRTYSEDPDVMFDTQLRFQRWYRFNVLQDAQLGLPDRWTIEVDFQNYYEAAWFGCPVEYMDDQVPDTRPIFADAPERVMERGMPEPFNGFGARAREFYEHFKARAARETFLDRPIHVVAPMCGTDGPMTAACNLCGCEFVCTMMAVEPERLHRLFDFIITAFIKRMTAWRNLYGIPIPTDGYGFADDSVALISTEMYREHVLPYHRRLCDAFATAAPRSIHLCGNATRHFRTIRDELNVQQFDTGFPVDFGWLRRELGPKVRIQGGPHVEFLRTAKPVAVREEVRRIMESGILEGGLFVLREANNLAPRTPLENAEAMYWAGREFGKFTER